MPLWDPSNTKSLHKIGGSRAGISRLGISHLLFSTLNVQICLFWVSMLNFGGVFFNKQCDGIPGKHVVFGCWSLHQLQVEPKRKPASCHSLCEKQCCLVPYFFIFFWGGRVCFFRYNFICLPWSDSLFPPKIRGPRDPESKELLLALTGVFELWDLNSRTVVRQRFLDIAFFLKFGWQKDER